MSWVRVLRLWQEWQRERWLLGAMNRSQLPLWAVR